MLIVIEEAYPVPLDIFKQIQQSYHVNFSFQMKRSKIFLPLLSSVIFSLPFWKNKMAELPCIPVSREKGMVPRGSWPLEEQEMRTEESKKEVGSTVLTIKYEPFFPSCFLLFCGFFVFLTLLNTYGGVEEDGFCAAIPAAFEGQVTGVAMWASTLSCLH